MHPKTYEIHVDGHIPPEELEEFIGMTAHEESSGTVLLGVIRDQAALTGLVDRIEALGLTVRAVTALDSGTGMSAGQET